MGLVRSYALAMCLMLFSGFAKAQTIPLQNLSKQDFEQVVEELSANSVHTSVSGAGTLGSVLGVEVGVVGGVAHSSELNKFAQRADPSAKADSLPHGEILGVVSVPLGFSIEAGLMPKVGSQSFKYSAFNMAVKWTATESLLELPFSLAPKLSLSNSHITFADTVSNVATTYKFDDQVTALSVLASKDFVLLEPYVGVGLAKASGKLSITGSSSVFNFTSASSATADRSALMWMVGTELKLLLVKLGVEYATAFGTSSFNGKLSFFF